MDSLSQIVLGAGVTVAVMGRRTSVRRAALWGAVAGTLPDLDVLIDHGDPVLNFVLHRAETHALAWLTLFSLPFAAALAALQGEGALWRRWWLALWLALVTHPLLDAMTIYGTQLGLPFTNHPVGLGSVFIIDPLYTVPLLVGVLWAAATRGAGRGLAANAAGLVLSTAYLAWGAWAQQHVQGVVRAELARTQVAAEQVLVTPSAFNSILWRVLVVSGDHYLEGFHSLLDGPGPIAFDRFERGTDLHAALRDHDAVRRVAAFSKGWFMLRRQGDRVLLADLRMGQEPAYVFTFDVAQVRDGALVPQPPRQVGSRPDLQRGLPWLWRRIGGERLPPPR